MGMPAALGCPFWRNCGMRGGEKPSGHATWGGRCSRRDARDGDTDADTDTDANTDTVTDTDTDADTDTPMGVNLDVGAHPGPMGSWMPMGLQSPHALRCTYGWLLPCLLNYCSAGPWVAAAAPPHSHPFSVPLPGGLRFLGFKRCCTLDSCDQAFVVSDAVSRASAWYSADESEVVARILSFCCGSLFRWLFVHCV